MDSRNETWFKKEEYDAIKNGCDVIIQSDIDSVRIPTLYSDQQSWLNSCVFEGMRFVLSHSKTRREYRYGESGCIIRTDKRQLVKIPIDGDYCSVKIITSDLYKSLANTFLQDGHLVCVHNHPSNSPLSYDDIAILFKQDIISSVVAVGNTHSEYILRKCFENGADIDFSSYYGWMQKRMREQLIAGKTTDKIKLDIAKYIRSNAAKFNLEYVHYRRRYND